MPSLQNSTILVTGGCGFIGSHLVQRLRRYAVHVRVVDSLKYGRRENLGPVDPGIQIKELELGSGSAEPLRQMLTGVDYVFHLAAEKHNQSVDSPERVLDANVIGTYELLRASAEAGVKKVVFTSSLYAYGRMSGGPMFENEVPTPQTIYGISKLTGEHLCRHFSLRRALPVVCLRLFFVYGPRQYSGLGYKSVIVKNFDRMINGEKPVICGDGMQTLDYIYVDDVVSALLLALTGADDFQVFNVGSGSGVTINELTALMVEVAGIHLDCDYAPHDFTSGSSRVASTNKFSDYSGFRPAVPLAEGLKRTFEWLNSTNR